MSYERSNTALPEDVQARLAAIVETAEDAIVSLDEDGRIVTWNRGAERLYGYAAAEVVGRSASLLLPPESADDLPGVLARLRGGERMPSYDTTRLHKDGRRIPVASSVSALTDAVGRFSGVSAIARDITHRKKVEEALRLSEQRYRLLTEAVPSLAWINQPDGAAIFYNQRWADYTGLGAREFEGTGFLAAVHPDDRGTVTAVRGRAISAGEPYEVEMRLRRHDGVFRWHAARVVPMRGEDGFVIAWFGAALDITERKAAEEALQAALEQQSYIAETLQRSMLRHLPSAGFPGLDVETLYLAALEEAQVGGDYFDAFALGGGRVALVVGDVSGKGLLAAAHTAEVKYALRAFLHEYDDPALALARLNDFLCDEARRDDHDAVTLVVLSLVVVDQRTGHAVCATAGAEPPLVLRRDGTEDLVSISGHPLGIEAGTTYDVLSLDLDLGDTLLMATDGVTEARRGPAFLGVEGMASLARAAGPAAALLQIGQAVMDGARRFTGAALRDDACLLLARRSAP